MDPLDPLSDVLSLLKPRAYVTGALSAGDPWSLQLPAYRGIKCYMVVEGTCWLAIEGESPARLNQGDCLLLPHGKPFVIASDLDLPAVDARKVVSGTARYQGVLPVTPGKDFLLFGTHFDLEGDAGFLLEALPSLVLLTGEQQCASMRWGVQRLLDEMRQPQMGGTLVAQQVASMLLIDALRLHQEQRKHGSGWFAALAEPQIRTTLACMHERPAHAWTLEELARSAATSDSVSPKLQEGCRRNNHCLSHPLADDPGNAQAQGEWTNYGCSGAPCRLSVSECLLCCFQKILRYVSKEVRGCGRVHS